MRPTRTRNRHFTWWSTRRSPERVGCARVLRALGVLRVLGAVPLACGPAARAGPAGVGGRAPGLRACGSCGSCGCWGRCACLAGCRASAGTVSEPFRSVESARRALPSVDRCLFACRLPHPSTPLLIERWQMAGIGSRWGRHTVRLPSLGGMPRPGPCRPPGPRPALGTAPAPSTSPALGTSPDLSTPGTQNQPEPQHQPRPRHREMANGWYRVEMGAPYRAFAISRW